MVKINRSVERGLDVVEVLLSEGPSSLAHLAQETQLPKATIIRLCATLEKRRWVIKRSSDGRYQLGSKIAMFTGQSPIVEQLVEVGKHEITRLSDDTGLAVDLAASVGHGRIEIVDTTRRYQLHKIPPDCIGYRPSPFRTALGLSFLAAMSPEDFAETIPKLAQTTPRDDRAALSQLEAVFTKIRKQGYALREENYWGRAVDRGNLPSAIGVAILANGRPIGSMNLVWAAEDRPVAEVADQFLDAAQATARKIGDQMTAQRGGVV